MSITSRIAALVLAGLIAGIGLPAYADGIINGGGSSGGGAGVSGAGLTLAPGAFAVTNDGSGYAAGDTVTLQCTGVAFSTIATNYGGPSGSPVLAITNTSPLGVSLIQTGYTKSAPATAPCTQASTTGSGTGLTLTVSFAPIAGAISQPMLVTGTGNAYNANLINAPGGLLSTFAGNASVIFGFGAGGNFSGAVAGITAFGENSCGWGGGIGTLTAATGSYNTCYGGNAGRNFSGAANNDTLVGFSAGGNETASGNGILSGAGLTFVGSAAGTSPGAANNITIVGAYAGQGNGIGGGLTILGASAGGTNVTGGNSTLLGHAVASTTLTTGTNDVIIGTSSSCDASGATASNEIDLCAGSSAVIRVTGAGTPATSTSTIFGQLVSATGTPTIASGACGTGTNGAVVTGSTNQSGQITIGSAATTSCTISWSATLSQAPESCQFFPMNATAAAVGTTLAYSAAPSTSGVVLHGTVLASANYAYLCL